MMRRTPAIAMLLSATTLLGACASGSSGDERGIESSGCSIGRGTRGTDTNTRDGSLEFDGVEREHNLSVPQEAGDRPLPLIVNMHGALATNDIHDDKSGIAEAGVEQGFLVVSPQGIGERPIWNLAPDGADVPYVLALIEAVGRSQCMDQSRVYATGFSMGGMMSLTLACTAPEVFAAVAPVAGTIEIEDCSARDLPVLSFHGMADSVVGFDGHLSPNVAILVGKETGASVDEVVADWGSRNGCEPDPAVMDTDDSVTRTVYSCVASTELVAIDGGEHEWPRSSDGGGSVDATEEILEFLAEER